MNTTLLRQAFKIPTLQQSQQPVNLACVVRSCIVDQKNTYLTSTVRIQNKGRINISKTLRNQESWQESYPLPAGWRVNDLLSSCWVTVINFLWLYPFNQYCTLECFSRSLHSVEFSSVYLIFSTYQAQAFNIMTVLTGYQSLLD